MKTDVAWPDFFLIICNVCSNSSLLLYVKVWSIRPRLQLQWNIFHSLELLVYTKMCPACILTPLYIYLSFHYWIVYEHPSCIWSHQNTFQWLMELILPTYSSSVYSWHASTFCRSISHSNSHLFWKTFTS